MMMQVQVGKGIGLDCSSNQIRSTMRAKTNVENLAFLLELLQCRDEIALLTDGERRYRAILFEICHELLKTGQPGRPEKVLPEGVQVK